MPRLILASASPRRRALLTQAGFSFTVHATDVDESPFPNEPATALALRLARLKAEAVPLPEAPAPVILGADTVILGADTVVLAPSGELLGKPAHASDAALMLRLLSGATHQVVTGVCVRSATRTEVAASLTYVTFLTLSDEEIASYLRTGEPFGKAGAYAIQGRAARWVSHLHGDSTNVVGLPLALTTTMLAAAGILPTL